MIPQLENTMAYQSLRFLDMFVTEKELAIEVAEVNGVQVDNVNLTKAGEDKILQELTADAASANHQNARLTVVDMSKDSDLMGAKVPTCLIVEYRWPKDCLAKRSRPMTACGGQEGSEEER